MDSTEELYQALGWNSISLSKMIACVKENEEYIRSISSQSEINLLEHFLRFVSTPSLPKAFTSPLNIFESTRLEMSLNRERKNFRDLANDFELSESPDRQIISKDSKETVNDQQISKDREDSHSIIRRRPRKVIESISSNGNETSCESCDPEISNCSLHNSSDGCTVMVESDHENVSWSGEEEEVELSLFDSELIEKSVDNEESEESNISLFDYARICYSEYNKIVFNNALSDGENVIRWSNRLTSTAGMCFLKTSKTNPRRFEISLSTSLCKTKQRVRDTLIHEMCHAAAWHINGVKAGHGEIWKNWAGKAMVLLNDIRPITVRHDYL